MLNTLEEEMFATTCVAVTALFPLQPLVATDAEAVHEVALVDDHERLRLLPWVTDIGPLLLLMRKSTVGAGAGGAPTLITTESLAVPLVPVQVIVNVLAAVIAPLDCEPLTALEPVQAPLAVQLVAFVLDQERVALLPDVTVSESAPLALISTVGGLFTGHTGIVTGLDVPAEDVVQVPRAIILDRYAVPGLWLVV